MKKMTIWATVCLLSSAFLFSCSKSPNPVSTTTTVSYSSMDTIFSMLNVQPKTLMVDAVNGGSFYGNSGTRYIFYGNSFQTATGANVTGTVQIQVAEYLQKGDMLFSKMLPISNNEPLISGGEINVVATQNGQPVYLKPHFIFQANMPQGGAAATGMQYFSGQPTLDTTQFKANWIQPALDTTHYAAGTVINVKFDTLGIISDSLRFCNADYFMISPNYQNFTVTVAVTGAILPAIGRVFTYALYDNYKGEWPIGPFGSYTNGVFTEHHVPNIPVHFVAFTLINGKFYGGIIGATPTTGGNYTVNLTMQDPTAFKTSLNQL